MQLGSFFSCVTSRGGLDLDGGLAVSGGELPVSGTSGMAQAPATSAAHRWVVATFDTQSAGSTVEVVDADGTVLHSWTPDMDFTTVSFSSADVQSGQTYTVVVDGTEVATATAGEFAGGGGGSGGGRGPHG